MLVMASANSTNHVPLDLPKPVAKSSEITKPTAATPVPVSGIDNELAVAQYGDSDDAMEELAPAFLPLDPALIGVLPNGVHVSRMASYSQQVQSALKKVLPTATDAIKAYNLTTQLTLQYMMNLNNSVQGRPILPRIPSLLPPPAAKQPPSEQSNATKKKPVKASKKNEGAPVKQEDTEEPKTKESMAVEQVCMHTAAKQEDTEAEPKRKEENISEGSSESVSCARHIPFQRSKRKQRSKLKELRKLALSSMKKEKESKADLKEFAQSFKKKDLTQTSKRKKVHAKIGYISSREIDIPQLLKITSRAKSPSDKESGERTPDEAEVNPSQEKDDKNQVQTHRRRKQILHPLVDTSASIVKSSDSHSHKPHPMRKRPSPHSEAEPSSSKKPRLHNKKTEPVPIQYSYVKRMASLNARACVTAMMEPERKPLLKSSKNSLSKSSLSKTLAESLMSLAENEAVLSKIAEGGGGQYVAIHHPTEIVLPEFNTLGLLHNGDTIHPTAMKVFYSTDNSDLTLPKLILPLLVPSRISTIGREVRNVEQVFRKPPKGNNGWRVMGNPIKTIEYLQNNATMTRQYYIGIQRRKDSVFVRDCVMLRSSPDEKPYIGKIASIWKENDSIMMTLFWYYRPEEVDKTGTAGITFRANELLASQHYDVNSVACIVDKCHILGLRQFCRYHASVLGDKYGPHAQAIPSLPSREQYISHVTDKATSHDRTVYFDLGPCIDEIAHLDPSLVYLCHRGYNHINGRIYQF